MAVLDVSFANKKTKKSSSNYGFLVDQLSIYESQLEADGKLSPGDFKALEKKAMEIYSHPGLSNDQRSNIQVKIASYKSQGTRKKLGEQQDISLLNRELDDESRKASMLLGNNPVNFLRAQVAAQSARVAQLAESINSLDAVGNDATSHLNEYNQALLDYQDSIEALDYVEKYQAGSGPKSDYVAYLTTNSRGEIVDVKISREGSKSGYLETNGLYGGMKIYGKLNRKENGKNVFVLGNTRFSGADVVIPGPDGTLKTNVLFDEKNQKGKSGVFTSAVASYTDVDPTTLKTQSAIRTGGYAQGEKGFIYKKNEDGTYTKYVNSDPAKLGIEENDLIRIPRSLESSIIGNVTETVDSAIQPQLPVPTNFTPATVQPSVATTAPATTTPPVAGRSPAAPTERAPQSNQGIASRAMGAARGFLGRLFGGQ